VAFARSLYVFIKHFLFLIRLIITRYQARIFTLGFESIFFILFADKLIAESNELLLRLSTFLAVKALEESLFSEACKFVPELFPFNS